MLRSPSLTNFVREAPNRARTCLLILLAIAIASLALLPATKTSALTGSDFDPSNIISGAVFTNAASMSAGDIQNFLNSKVTCDTNGAISFSYYYNSGTGEINNSSTGTYVTTSRAVYGQRYDTYKGTTIAAAPYVCLKDYVENPTTGQNNLQNPTASIPGGQNAAQIIYNAAQAYTINPEVLLVTLQKEQALVTDDWPWTIEYTEATGFNCPDTASGPSCNGFAGLYQQVTAAAKQYRNYLNNPNNFNYVVGANNIYYNVTSSCSQSSNVNIQNQSTAALYDYTPYQPNSGVLAHTNPTGSPNGPGGSTGDLCGSYGNRNFWWYFTTWFGSTQTTVPYAWTFTSSVSYADSARTSAYSASPALAITPDGTAYLSFQARNNGNQTWSQSTTRLGTSGPRNRSSIFADSSWVDSTRISLQQTTVAPGDNGTFLFDLKAPASPGSYTECFEIVADGISWMTGPNLCYIIDVVTNQESNDQNLTMTPGQSISTGSYLMSPAAHTILLLQTDGNLVLYSDSVAQWNTGTSRSGMTHLVMQTDGNLVLYNQANSPVWSSGTVGNTNARAVLQSDGNLVVYSSTNTALWSSGTYNIPSFGNTVLHALSGGVLYPQQSLQMADRSHQLIMQRDGNLVLYSAGQPVWASYTQGHPGAFAVMQSDGNFVIYSSSQQALWASYTNNNPGSTVVMQNDGNLVIYNTAGKATWQSQTYGR